MSLNCIRTVSSWTASFVPVALLTAILAFAGPLYSQPTPTPCDVDGNRTIDLNDITAITAARNTPAGPDDPRDADGDGTITVLDARKCVLKCTVPGCAVQPLRIELIAAPEPNGARWNSDEVTVSSICSGGVGPLECPEPFTVTTEGGNQQFTLEATDANGNSASTSISLNVDRSPPTVAITLPSNGVQVDGTPLEIQGNVSDGVSGVASLLCNGNEVMNIDGGAFACSVTLTEGENQVIATATDLADNSASDTITVFLLPPSPAALTSVNPNQGQAGTQLSVTITGENTSFEAGSTVASFGTGVSVGGSQPGEFGPLMVDSPTSTSAVLVVSSGASPGPRDVVVRTDGDELSLVNGFTVVSSPGPGEGLTILITDPSPEDVLTESSITVRGTVNDPDARVIVQGRVATLTGTTFEARRVPLFEGANSLVARARNIAGNEASTTVSVVLDATPPSLTIFSPQERGIFTEPSARVTGSVTDATEVVCSINGNAVGVQDGGFSAHASLVEGLNEITVACQDAAGSSVARSLTLFYDATPLAVAAVTPGDRTTDIPTTSGVSVQFSEPVRVDSIGPSTCFIRAGPAIIPTGLTVSPDGLTVNLTPALPLPSGTDIDLVVTEGVADSAGIPLSFPFTSRFTTSGVTTQPGAILGEVFDDTRSLPLEAATVEALDLDTHQLLESTQTNEQGRYLLFPGQTDVLLRISMPGFTRVDRTVGNSQGSFADVLDVRLTPLSQARVVSSAFGATLQDSGGNAFLLPPGAVDVDTAVRLTRISQQGPRTPFPVGWTPLSVVDINAPGAFDPPATLTLSGNGAPPGTPAVLARYDESVTQWVTMQNVPLPPDGRVQLGGVTRAGQFALLVADIGEGAPPTAALGQPIPAGSSVPLPVDATASGEVTPEVGRADDPTPANATVNITSDGSLRSGTAIRGEFMELIFLREGGQVSAPDTMQDLITYRPSGEISQTSLTASFPIAPSRVFGPAEVNEGSITVTLLGTAETSTNVIGAHGGGILTGDGSQVILPPGVLPGNVPVDLRRLSSNSFPGAPQGLTFLGGLELDLPGVTSPSPLSLTLAGAASLVPTGSSAVVAQLRDVKGKQRLVLVALARIEGDSLTTQVQAGGVIFPGVRRSGRYGFFRFDGSLIPVAGTARDDADRRDGHVVQVEGLAPVSVTDPSGSFALVSPPGPFTVVATAAELGDQVKVDSETGVPLPEIVIGATPPRVERITVRRPKLEGNFAGPLALLGNPRPIIDDDGQGQSAGNGNGQIDPGEAIELTLYIRNDGTVALEDGSFRVSIRGPTGAVASIPESIPLDSLPPDEPFPVGPFVFTAPPGNDPSALRPTLDYLTNGGLADSIPFSLPLEVEHPDAPVESEIEVRFSEPVRTDSLSGALTLSRLNGASEPVATNLIVSNDGSTATLRPLATLEDDTLYHITIGEAIVDRDGRPLQDAPLVETMRTEDVTPPLIAPGQIETSIPDAEGFVTITGSPGSVNPQDIVIGLNETTGFTALADVNADGSFSVRLRAAVTDQLSILVRDLHDNQTRINPGPFVRRDAGGQIVSTVLPRSGGVVTNSEGIRLTIPAGALFGATEISVSRVTEPFVLPPDLAGEVEVVEAFNGLFEVADRVEIEADTNRFAKPIGLGLPAPAGTVVGDLFFVVRSRTVTIGGPLADLDRLTGIRSSENPVRDVERLQVLESATVKDEGGQLVLSTDSPPFPGISEPGVLTLLMHVGPTPMVSLAGEVRRNSNVGRLVQDAVVRSLPGALATSPFVAVTGPDGRFVIPDANPVGIFQNGAVVSSRLDVRDPDFARVIRRDVRGIVGAPAPRSTTIAHLEEPFVLPERLPSELTDALGDLEPPTVAILVDGPTLLEQDDPSREVALFSRSGARLEVTVTADDNDQVSFRGLQMDLGNGLQAVALMPDGTFTTRPILNGVITFRAQARDRNGNVTFVDKRVRIVLVRSGGSSDDPVTPDDIIQIPGVPPELLSLECEAFDAPLEATFSEPLNPATVNDITVQLRDPEGQSVKVTVTTDRNVVLISPLRNLRLGATYEVEFSASIEDQDGEHLAGETRSCEIPPPRLITIFPMENVKDVALVGETVVAVNHPDGTGVGDDGMLHTLGPTFDVDGNLDGLELLSSVPVTGRPLSLAVDGTTAFVGNRFLGSIASERAFVDTFVLGSSETFPDRLEGCGPISDVPTPVTPSNSPIICSAFTFRFDRFPQPASNIEVFDVSDPADPQRTGIDPINNFARGTAGEIWNPNTWPGRVEVTPQGVAVQNSLSNIEFFAPTPQPRSLGIVGQITRLGEVTPRGPDGRLGTDDDLDNEFFDAVYFDGFAVTVARDGMRIVSTETVGDTFFGEQAIEMAFVPLLSTRGVHLGGVPRFEYVNQNGDGVTSDLAFLSTLDEQLQVFDVTNPRSPQELGSLSNAFGTMSFDACLGVAYLHDRDGTFEVIDFNEPTTPLKLNRPGPGATPFNLPNPGLWFTLNGSANRNGFVYLVGESQVGVVHLNTDASRYSYRQACQLRLIPSEAVIPVGGTQNFVVSRGGRSYAYTIQADTTGGAAVVDRGNGAATYVAGPDPGESVVQASVSNSAPVIATGHVVAPSVDLNVSGLREVDEETIGAWVAINADNDNGSTVANGIPQIRDRARSPVANEDDLLRVELSVTPPSPLGELAVTVRNDGRARVAIWDTPTKESLLLGVSSGSSNVGTLPMGQRELWVEGVREGQAQREVLLSVDFMNEHGQAVSTDAIRITVTPVLEVLKVEEAPGAYPDIDFVRSDPTAIPRWGIVTNAHNGGSGPVGTGGVSFNLSATAFAVNVTGQLRLVQNVRVVNTIGASSVFGGATSASSIRSFDFAGANAGMFLLDARPADVPFFGNNEVWTRTGPMVSVMATDNPTLWLEPLNGSAHPPQNSCAFPDVGCVLPGAGTLTAIDVTYEFETHAAWQFDDGTVWFLGSTDWNVRFSGVVRHLNGLFPYYTFSPNSGNGNTGNRSAPILDQLPIKVGPPVANQGGQAWR